MSIRFNADEILEIAEEIEHNGRAFYALAAEQTEPGESRDLLLRLANWEEKHEQMFKDMREAFAREGGLSPSFDPKGEAALYLQAIADGKIFVKQAVEDELAALPDGIIPILKAALNKEKDTVVFFLAMKDMVPEELGQQQVDDILREEMGHVLYLTDELCRYNGTNEGGM